MSVITCRSNDLSGALDRPVRSQESIYTYLGGTTGEWEVTGFAACRGEPLARISHLQVVHGPLRRVPAGTAWVLSGLVRRTRYVALEEPRRQARDRIGATCAALISIRRARCWWDLVPQERSEIQTNRWTAPAHLRLLSTIIHRWQHPRDLSSQFDVVTWFEYESHDAPAFDELLAEWRASAEWKYVDREVDLRLTRSRVS